MYYVYRYTPSYREGSLVLRSESRKFLYMGEGFHDWLNFDDATLFDNRNEALLIADLFKQVDACEGEHHSFPPQKFGLLRFEEV